LASKAVALSRENILLHAKSRLDTLLKNRKENFRDKQKQNCWIRVVGVVTGD
jgi:hypothetical protein